MRRFWILVALALLAVPSGAAAIQTAPWGEGVDGFLAVLSDQPGLVTGGSWLVHPDKAAADQLIDSGARPVGVSTTPISDPFDVTGSFAIISNGDVTMAADAPSNNADKAYTGSARGANDVLIAAVDVSLAARDNCLSFDFQFLSEEYPDYVGDFNDAFIAELDTSDWSISGNTLSAPHNFAFDQGPSGEPVAISVNAAGAATMNGANAAGSVYGGATTRLTAHTPTTPGAHTLYLSIFDAGDSAYDSTVFLAGLRSSYVPDPSRCSEGVTVVSDPPVADFTIVAPEPARSTDRIAFTPTATPAEGRTLVAWDWTLDGTTDPRTAADTVTHVFEAVGTFNVTLRVTDDVGNQDSVTKRVTITNQDPTAGFTYGPTPVGIVTDVTFTSTATDPDGPVTSWSWDFGDGTTSKAQTPVHRFATSGSYPVSLTVTDADGGSDRADQMVEVINLPPQPTVLGDAEGLTGDPMHFTADVEDPEGYPTTVRWTFPDGTSATTPQADWTPQRPGAYTIRLSAWDNEGLEGTAVRVVHAINRAPTAAFGVAETGASTGEAWRFQDQSADPDGQITAWSWDFGDGTAADEPAPQHRYADVGTFTVRLTVTDDTGLSASTQQEVRVDNHAPVARFDANGEDGGLQLLDLSFDVDGTVRSRAWELNGEPLGTTREVLLDAPGGPIRVRLTVTDDDGAVSTTSRIITWTSEGPTVQEPATEPAEDPDDAPSEDAGQETPADEPPTEAAATVPTRSARPVWPWWAGGVLLVAGIALAGARWLRRPA